MAACMPLRVSFRAAVVPGMAMVKGSAVRTSASVPSFRSVAPPVKVFVVPPPICNWRSVEAVVPVKLSVPLLPALPSLKKLPAPMGDGSALLLSTAVRTSVLPITESARSKSLAALVRVTIEPPAISCQAEPFTVTSEERESLPAKVTGARQVNCAVPSRMRIGRSSVMLPVRPSSSTILVLEPRSPRRTRFPESRNAPAPVANCMAPNIVSAGRSFTVSSRVEPAKTSTSACPPLGATSPAQFPGVLQLSSPPPPSQVNVPASVTGGFTASATTHNVRARRRRMRGARRSMG